jgi:FMN phosphatase YigB (HAD superfamily)
VVAARSVADALLFDLGNVVIDIDFNRAFARWAHHASADAVAIRGRFSHDDAYRRHERGEIGASEYFSSLRGSLGIDISDSQFADGWNAIFIGETPGMSDLLARLAPALPLYAFTNSNRAHELYWSRRFADILGRFRAIHVSSSIGLRKPDVQAFDFVVESIGVPAGRIVFFDDVGENIDGARAAGLRAVQVTTSADVANAVADLGLWPAAARD